MRHYAMHYLFSDGAKQTAPVDFDPRRNADRRRARRVVRLVRRIVRRCAEQYGTEPFVTVRFSEER
jgi:hypothetical protein